MQIISNTYFNINKLSSVKVALIHSRISKELPMYQHQFQ